MLCYALLCNVVLYVTAMLCMLTVEIEVQGLHDPDGTVVSDGARDLHELTTRSLHLMVRSVL
jgi:hypothetical protein